MTRDWVGVVEAGYDLAGDQTDWLNRLLDAAVPLMDRGIGVNAQVFRVSATRFALDGLAVRGLGTVEQLRGFVEEAPPEALDAIYRRGAPVGSLSEWLFPSQPLSERTFRNDSKRLFVGPLPAGFQDSMGLVAHTGTGWGVVLGAPLPTPGRMRGPERGRWRRVAAHLAAGLRLRLRFAALDPGADRDGAVLTPGGRVADARGEAEGATARDRLRAAVRDRERARAAAGRADPDAALRVWEGLVAGRWSLVDHFEADGRRVVVAVPNDPAVPDPRGLSVRERQVCQFFGMGRGPKQIGYILGLSGSTVGHALARARDKLGLGSAAELAAFFAPGGVRARLEEAELAGERVAVGAYPLADPGRLAGLTEAERAVAVALARGATYAAIAADRDTAARTVANQVQAIYRKLGVGSRQELCAALGG
jgi:DNA-binding CsgD family transcriptional regulator